MFKQDYANGKALREKVSRGTHAEWETPSDRPSVKEQIILSNYDRLPGLIPIRHYRMTESPFVFYRATASLMARDLSHTPSSGIDIHICGDCHLMNFGGFATPERTLVADINDFDETNPGPWEWDLKRLSTSFVLACRSKGLSDSDAHDVTFQLLSTYREKMLEYAQMNFLELWYTKFTFNDLSELSDSKKFHAAKDRLLKKVNKQSHHQVLYKITAKGLTERVIVDQYPLIYHPFDMDESRSMIQTFMNQYKATLQPDRKLLLDQYRVVDVALKVVGVGSVGTRCYVVLLMNDNEEPIFLQVKEARQSVLEPYTQQSEYRHNGERVVQGQRIIQAASDIFLGWSVGPDGRHFYVRQLRDKKIAFGVDTFKKLGLELYARMCGTILARAHAKSGKGAFIAGYIGNSDKFLEAVNQFSLKYANQTERDYDDFMKAVKAGILPIEKEPPKES